MYSYFYLLLGWEVINKKIIQTSASFIICAKVLLNGVVRRMCKHVKKILTSEKMKITMNKIFRKSNLKQNEEIKCSLSKC